VVCVAFAAPYVVRSLVDGRQLGKYVQLLQHPLHHHVDAAM
jgi:hypothetical protein